MGDIVTDTTLGKHLMSSYRMRLSVAIAALLKFPVLSMTESTVKVAMLTGTCSQQLYRLSMTDLTMFSRYSIADPDERLVCHMAGNTGITFLMTT